MAIEFVGAVANSQAGGTGGTNQNTTVLTGGIGSAPASGDLVIFATSVGTAGRTPTWSPSGNNSGTYTEIGTTLDSQDTYDTRLAVFYQFQGSTPDTRIDFARSGDAADGHSWIIAVYRGVDPTTPFDVSSVTATGGNTSRPNPPSITPITSGARVVVFGAGAAATTSAYTTSGLSNVQQTRASDTNDSALLFGDVSWTSGAVDIAQFGGGSNTTSDSWASRVIALRPAPAVFTGTGAVSIGAPSLASTGKETFKGPAALTAISAPSLASTGTQAFKGPATVAIGAPSLSASGTFSSGTVTGTGSVSIGPPSLVSSGYVEVRGSAQVAIGGSALLGTGKQTFKGSGALQAIQAPSLSATGKETFKGPSSVGVGPPAASGTGSVLIPPVTGSGALGAIGPPSIDASASLVFLGQGDALVPLNASMAGLGTADPPQRPRTPRPRFPGYTRGR